MTIRVEDYGGNDTQTSVEDICQHARQFNVHTKKYRPLYFVSPFG